MPAVLAATKTHIKAATGKDTKPKPKHTRIVRRRGRARGTIDSDDELEREARSDSGSDDDKSSDSDSDVDSIHSSSILHNGHSATVTPSTTESPPKTNKSLSNGNKFRRHHHPVNGDVVAPPIPTTTDDWSEMVSAEGAWGSLPLLPLDKSEQAPISTTSDDWSEAVSGANAWGSLPLRPLDTLDPVDEQLSKPSGGSRARKNRKGDKKVKTKQNQGPPQGEPENEQFSDQPVASTSRRDSHFPPRGRSAREAYQSRLQADPSYVPTVGEFWGHDDRLLDKELRSLSGWWRGRWQTRGGFGNRGRGFFGSFGNPYDQEAVEGDALSAIDRPWGHDGFEEMKMREEHRRQIQRREQESQPTALQRGTGLRGGRGGFFAARGRGGFNRGGIAPSSPRSISTQSDRPWFAMKPERMWTKQLDWFLLSDPSLKPRPGHGQGFRVKLAGNGKERVIRTPPRRFASPHPSNPATTTQNDVPQSENEDKAFVVRLPSRTVKELDDAAPFAHMLEPDKLVPDSTTDETEESLEEVFTVKPRAVPSAPIPALAVHDPMSASVILPLPPTDAATAMTRSELIERAVVKSPQQQQVIAASSSDATVNNSILTNEESRPESVSVPTVFSPITPPHSYNASYQYGPALPPGVAMNSQGMAYEIATGRPVYLQPTPPPLYDPRPIMATHMPLHASRVAFIPGHMHHHPSGSPDYLASQPHSRSPSGFVDPMTGMPIFSFPRQNSRIEIRRPTDTIQPSISKSPQNHAHRPSGLRTTVSAVEPNREDAQQMPSEYYPSIPDQRREDHDPTHSEERGTDMPRPMDPTIMAYQPYQPYYYSEYGYPAYVDASQMQYDMYQEQSNSQPTIYY